MAQEPGAVVDETDQEWFDVRAATRQARARAVMEVKMQELQDMRDFVAADLALLEPLAGGQGAVAHPAQRALTQPPLCFQIPPHARIGRTRRAGGRKGHAQIVVVQLRSPARMLGVLHGERLHRVRRQTREAADVATHLVTRAATGSWARRAAYSQRSMVEQPKRISRPVNGWRQVVVARAFKAACKAPSAGGAASSGPMIAKRSRAQRSRWGKSSLELKRHPHQGGTIGTAHGTAHYKVV